MQPISIFHLLKKDVVEYVASKYPFLDKVRPDLHDQLVQIMLKQGALFQDPVFQIVRSRKQQEFNFSHFHPKLANLVKSYLPTPYTHQIQAWLRLSENKPTVVSTGTGSGKSEAFIFPVIDGLLKAGFDKKPGKIGALFLYPMNALVEDQLFRILKYIKGTGLKVRVYTGSYKKPGREFKYKIESRLKELKKKGFIDDVGINDFFVDPEKRSTIPHILLTNYKMLEYTLLRSEDQGLFEDVDLKYLALDEAHIYTGTLGLEISCLLARLQVHLGEKGQNFVPIATSATLAHSDVSTEQDRQIEDMRSFFTGLFNKEFNPKDPGWLIRDQFVELKKWNKDTISPFLKCDEDDLRDALTKPWPDGFQKVANLLFGLELRLSRDIMADYCKWGTEIYPRIKAVAEELPSLLLTDDQGKENAVVDWAMAVERFKKRVMGSEALLEALLVLASQAFPSVREERFWPSPALGLRVHVFGRAQPQIAWTLDKKTLIAEDSHPLAEQALDLITCRQCGHMAWGAQMIPSHPNGADLFELKRLPDFYEDEDLPTGQEIAAFHHHDDIDEELENKRSKWSFDYYELNANQYGVTARPLAKNAIEKAPKEKVFVRVRREAANKDFASDMDSCPHCGKTATKRAVLSTQRGGASTDLSIYGASILTNMDLENERRLLFFCDNRQETSFLAGFLTDRHRRLNFRRAVASFLHEAKMSGDEDPWSLFNDDVKHDGGPRGHQFDFMARLLISLKEGRFIGRTNLPSSLSVPKRLLQDLIPKEFLEVDKKESRDQSQISEVNYKNWLLDNRTIESSSSLVNEESLELFNHEKGEWCLRLLTNILLVELSGILARESGLPYAGIACYGFTTNNENYFDEWTKSNQAFLDGRGLRALTQWLTGRLASLGLWSSIDVHTQRRLGERRFESKGTKLQDIFGTNFNTDKGLSKNSRIGRLLLELGGENAFSYWSKWENWLRFIDEGPGRDYFEFFGTQDVLKLKSKRCEVHSMVDVYRSSRSHDLLCVPAGFDFTGLPSGKKEEQWVKQNNNDQSYYRELYIRPLNERSRLIRASEHNGMLSATRAAEVIDQFDSGALNTLVATPTLEMGVDLPDLPIVIHRNVPPDPSNYAQRAGRAGRGPKRALIITHCGRSAHDMTFFEVPRDMVAGEILPPGLPVENISILKRHINGLVLELLGIKDKNGALDVSRFDQLVDLSPLHTKYCEISGEKAPPIKLLPQDWRKLLSLRSNDIVKAVDDFLKVLGRGLWCRLAEDTPERLEYLHSELKRAGNPAEWSQAFERELNRFQQLIEDYINASKNIRDTLGQGGQLERNVRNKEINRLDLLINQCFNPGWQNTFTYPLGFFAASGFLPNFDFPGKLTRFVGTIDQLSGKNERIADEEKILTYGRQSQLSLREFAPEQTVYGHGFVYKIDRYVARSDSQLTLTGPCGICMEGCTELSPADASVCKHCGGDLVQASNDDQRRPKLIEIEEAQGRQHSVISDVKGKRDHHYYTQEVRKYGAGTPDERWVLKEDSEIQLTRHLGPESQISTITILKSKVSGDKKSGTSLVPVYKERGEKNQFSVRLGAPQEDEFDRWEPFLPCVFSKGQAMTLSLPPHRVQMFINEDDGDLKYFITFKHIFLRATQRVLRLNKRKASLNVEIDKIRAPEGDGLRKAEFLFIDLEEGGSGVIDLVWTYWDSILKTCEAIVRSNCCSKGCYKCVLSYDNQYEHELINKEIFRVDGETVFSHLLKGNGIKSRWEQGKVEKNQRQQKVDENSHIEKVFQKYLDKKGWKYVTQTSMLNVLGTEITRPDFLVTLPSGEQITIYLDGKRYHAEFEKFLSDIEKRNFVVAQGRRVFTFPGGLFSPLFKEQYFDEFFSSLVSPVKLSLSHSDEKVSVKGDVETFKNVWKLGLNELYDLDKKALIGELKEKKSFITGELVKMLESMGDEYLPIGLSGDFLLVPIDGEKIFFGGDPKSWDKVVLLYSLYAALGYKVVQVWLSPRKIKKVS